ncbi:MAG: hypothetical protein LBL07_19135 [Tannerella sp.]|jgi:uncharacterized protein YfaS (alpha-2-macroglobulin family)|nr:hypothetical protein [Tannerella sp.]
MKKIFYIAVIVTVVIIACVSQNKPVVKKDMNKYTKEWAEIELFRQQGLPKSLFPKVEAIYQSALAEGNYEQLIKAVIFRINSIGILEENEEGANKIFNDLKKDAEQLPQPARSIIYSMIGEMYEVYYNQNAWTINSRTNTATDPEDIHTWDARKLAEEAIKYYDLSLQDVKTLQNEPVDSYKEILLTGYDPDYQPTLYDLLANRALAYYASDYNVHSLSQQAFVANDPDFFAGAPAFSTLTIRSEDTLSPVYLSLKTYQERLRFHLDKSNFGSFIGRANEDITALVDVDLRRMAYLKEKGRYADNEMMYEKALVEMSKAYKPYDANATVLLQLGGFYLDRGAVWRDDKKEGNKSGYTKAYELYERMTKEYPGKLNSNAGALKENILYRELEIQFEATQLPGKPVLALLNYRNIDTLHTIIYKLTKWQAIDYNNVGSYKRNRRYELPDFIKTLKVEPVKERLQLPVQTDYQYYTTEIKMGPYEKGFYLVIVSDSENPLASPASVYNSSLLQASSLAAQDRMIDRVITVLVTDRETGKPVPGATVEVSKDTPQVIASFTSDRDGIARSGKFPGYFYNQYYSVDCKNDQLLVFGTGYNRDIHTPDSHDNAFIFTDRSIYRPGQAVYFKAILYNRKANESGELLKRKTVQVRLRDVNRQVVSEQRLTSGDFGSIDGSFTIPQGLLNGNMTLECTDYASTSIRVEEYKRPTFEVNFDPVDGNPALNKPVRVTAGAKALAGYAIDNAGVQYRVVRHTHYRFFYWWYPPVNDSREISSGTVKTDAEGRFSIDFTALADDVKDDLIYTYTVTADVTDVNGETRSASLQVNAGNKPLLVTANLPETILPGGKAGEYTVETTNLNGDPAPASVKVKIIALKTPGKILRRRVWDTKVDIRTIPEDEFRKDFPLDAYADELNPDRLEELRTVAEYTIETPGNKKLDLSSMKQSGYYKIALRADNRKGIVAEDTRYVYLPGDQPGVIPDMDKWLTVVTDSGEPGDEAEFWVAGGQEDSHVYYELIHKDRIVEAKWITAGTTPLRLTFPIKEEHRGGLGILFSMIRDNRLYSSFLQITVPYTNKMLDVKLATFRDKLLPGENETWTMLVSDKKGEKEAAEIVASLYDASLDAIQPHHWPDFSRLYSRFVNAYTYSWNTSSLERLAQPKVHNGTSPASWPYAVYLTDLNWYDATYRDAFYANTYAQGRPFMIRGLARNKAADVIDEEEVEFSAAPLEEKMDMVASAPAPPAPVNEALAGRIAGKAAKKPGADVDPATVATRTNFNETAVFYPKLRTNEQGEVLIEFTMPEALTRWKLLSFAHTKDLKIGSYSNELITQKQVAITVNPPRFFRENDVIELTAKVTNLTESSLDGQALLRLYDAVTMEPVDDAMIRSEKTQAFSVKAGAGTGLRWQLTIPEGGPQAVVYRVTAQAGTHTDGEEKTVPILANSMLVTETLPFSIRAGKEKTFTLDKLVKNESKTLRNRSLTLEFTSAPAWYAVQALPYLMEYPYECSEQTFSRYYANTLATTVVNKTPRIKQIFERWNTPDSKALLSNLEKNQELKQLMLEETPWVMQATDETERKKRIGLLFDLNRMSNELNRAFNRLKKMQNSDGGFPWFEGLPSTRYITQHIVAGMAHLKKLDAIHSTGADAMIREGLRYLDVEIWKDYDDLIRRKADLKKQQISSIQLHYLYACSFSGHQPEEGKRPEAFRYYLEQAGTYWKTFSTCEKAMAALVLYRNNQPDRAMKIIRSLKEYAQQSEEMGMYWKDNVAGYSWHQAPVETQALLIEAFNEAAKDGDAVEEMKIWLLRNKQTNDWKTTKATSEAIYALLMTGGNLLDESRPLEIEIGDQPLAQVAKEVINPEPGTGYVKTNWPAGDITPRMGRLKVKNPNSKGIAWGGLYWQYFEQLDKITPAETNLKMQKQLFLRTLTKKGEELQPVDGKLKVGDLVRVRMELRADRDYEYVHLKDMRASGFEPVSTRSGHRYQDGLWYYESIKDASTNFFITNLRKGVYVFEYDLRVSHAGDFSNGITTFQCMYAPEFSSHSEGIRVTATQ